MDPHGVWVFDSVMFHSGNPWMETRRLRFEGEMLCFPVVRVYGLSPFPRDGSLYFRDRNGSSQTIDSLSEAHSDHIHRSPGAQPPRVT